MKESPKHIHISEYNYPLPDERIAKFPLPIRDQSKLLVYRHGEVTEDRRYDKVSKSSTKRQQNLNSKM